MAESKRNASAKSPVLNEPKTVLHLAAELVARMDLLAKPDRARERAALDAISDAESLAEGWERVVARGLVPTGWLDDAQRRFYGQADRCARCGRPTASGHAGCSPDERAETHYAFAAFPTSWWDLIVLVGHSERFAEAEALARDCEAKIGEKSSDLALSPDAQRCAWTWVFEKVRPAYYSDQTRREVTLTARATELAERTVGLPLSNRLRETIRPLYKWLSQREPREQSAPEVKSSIQFLGETEVSYAGQNFGWSELRCALLPSSEAARSLPRGVALGP